LFWPFLSWRVIFIIAHPHSPIVLENCTMTRFLLSVDFSAALLARAGAADVITGFLQKLNKGADGSEHKYTCLLEQKKQ
jgi:hypothetical protein